MKKFILAFVTAAMLIGCGVSNKMSRRIFYEYNKDYSEYSVDSVCLVEEIPSPFTEKDMWIDGTVMRDYETNEAITQLLYIKNDSTTFILTPNNHSIYNFKKKIIRTVSDK